jgi:hypothetical protein
MNGRNMIIWVHLETHDNRHRGQPRFQPVDQLLIIAIKFSNLFFESNNFIFLPFSLPVDANLSTLASIVSMRIVKIGH